MRETSYFKQQTDDEGALNRDAADSNAQGAQNDPQSLSELISITN